MRLRPRSAHPPHPPVLSRNVFFAEASLPAQRAYSLSQPAANSLRHSLRVVCVLLQSTPYNRSFVPANTQSSAHVLITGDLDATNVALFLRELFHADHFPRNRQLKAVLLTPTEPSDALKALVESAQYAVCTVCLKGSPLNVSANARCHPPHPSQAGERTLCATLPGPRLRRACPRTCRSTRKPPSQPPPCSCSSDPSSHRLPPLPPPPDSPSPKRRTATWRAHARHARRRYSC